MKKIVLAFLFIVVFFTATAQHDEHFIFGAGALTSHAKGSTLKANDELGYYLKAGITGRVGERFGHEFAVLFQNQLNRFEGATLTAQSVNLAASFRLYPVKQGLHLLGGIQMGMHTKIEIADSTDDGKVTILPMAGLGYDFGKISASARGGKYVGSGNLFQNNFQFGLSCSL